MVGDDPDDQTESSGTGDDSSLVLGAVAIIAIAAGAIWLVVTILSGNGHADDPAAPPTNTIDQGQCARIATEWKSFRIDQLVPLVDADETATSAAAFRAVSPALEDLIDTMDRWTTGLHSSTVKTRFETAIADGRTLQGAIQGGDVDESAGAGSAFIDSSDAAFAACQN